MWIGSKYYLKNELLFIKHQDDDNQVIARFSDKFKLYCLLKFCYYNKYSIIYFIISKAIYTFLYNVWYNIRQTVFDTVSPISSPFC